MKKLDNLVQDFLAQKKIAIIGVSDKRDTGCNLTYQKFKENGYQVYAVHRIDLVTILLELLVRQVTARIALIRYADNGNLLLCEEVLYEIIEFFHINSPLMKKPEPFGSDLFCVRKQQ